MKFFGFGPQTLPTNQNQQSIDPLIAELIDQANMLRSPMLLHKDSIKLCPDDTGKKYDLQFICDTSLPCSVQVFWVADERALNQTGSHYILNGMNQKFSQNVAFIPSKFSKEELSHKENSSTYPLVISITALANDVHITQLLTLTTLNETADGWEVKTVQQKVKAQNNMFIVNDIYGVDDSSATEDCAICLSYPRDTVIIPCRHMCVCHQCAQELWRQSKKCPICRGLSRAMVQISVPSWSVDTESASSEDVAVQKLANLEIESEDSEDVLVKPKKEKGSFANGDQAVIVV